MFKLMFGNKWVFEIAPSGKPLFILKCVLSMFADLLLVLYPLILGKMIDAAFYKNSWTLFMKYIFIYVIVFLANQLLQVFITKFDIAIKKRFTNILKKALFEKSISAKAIHLSEINSADLINIISTDVENITKFFDEVILTIIRSYFYIGILFMIILQYSWEIAIAVIFFAMLTVYLADVPKKKFRIIKKKYRNEYGEFLSWVMEALNGMQDIRVNSAENVIGDDFRTFVKKLLKSKEKARFIEIKAERFNGFFTAVFTLSFWILSAIFVVNQRITVGVFFAIEKYFSNVIVYINRIKQAKINSHNYYPSFDKINDQYQYACEELEVRKEEVDYSIGKGQLEFENVAFKYTNVPVIKNLNMCINEGDFLSIVGANGEGKSTILGLITKFYDVESGCIKLGGKNIDSIPLRELREQIGYVQQNTIIFEGTLEENMKLYKSDVKEDEIWSALKICGLYDTVVEWQDGLQTDLMNGERLSAGQRQRISFARTLLKDPQIILLDEPTSNLDYETEMLIVDELRDIFPDKILIMISHRPVATKAADKIAVLQNGAIRDVGTNEELLERCQIYKELFLNNFDRREVDKHELS